MKYQDILTVFSIVILLTSLNGCNAGSGEGLDAQGQPIVDIQPPPAETETPSDPEPEPEPEIEVGIQPTLSSIQNEVFTPICSVCHGGPNPAAGQNLSTIEDSIANLINVPSSNPLFKRVLPGSAEESYLYLKITGNSLAGARMPLGQPALTAAQIDAIKQWITQGALIPENISTTIVSRAARTTTAQMRQNNTEQVTLWFNQPIDFAAFTREQLTLQLIHQTANSGEQVQPLTYEQAAITIVDDHTVKINAFIAVDDQTDVIGSRLKITLNNSSIATLTSVMGQTLDGDNNGVEGGEFSYDLDL